MGTLTGMTDLGIFMGPAVMGMVIQVTTYPTMFICLSLVGVLSLFYFKFLVVEKKGSLLLYQKSLLPDRLAPLFKLIPRLVQTRGILPVMLFLHFSVSLQDFEQ